ncbi:peroxin-5, partial [Phenoliferia sp. Uapishka_3]
MAACGTSNPLAHLSKVYERNAEQDFLHAAGPSEPQQAFRQSNNTTAIAEDANRFFHHPFPSSQPFDLSTLRSSLTQSSTQEGSWASSFASTSARLEAEPNASQTDAFHRAFEEKESLAATDHLSGWSDGFSGGIRKMDEDVPSVTRQAREQWRAAKNGTRWTQHPQSWQGVGFVQEQQPITFEDSTTSAWEAAFAQHTARLDAPPLSAFNFKGKSRALSNYERSLIAAESIDLEASSSSTGRPSAPSSVMSYEPEASDDIMPKLRSALELYDLGIQHQISEREPLAIAALLEATSLDAKLGPAHLALAMSYGNEGRREEAYSSVEDWVTAMSFERYREPLHSWSGFSQKGRENGGVEGRHEILFEILMGLVEFGSQSGEVDPEVQIGLGLLFTLTADFAKAEDCFGAALTVLPEDPLLWNRLGVTRTNAGKAEEALPLFEEALDLYPGYIRCRVNLAIANVSLKRFPVAVEHLIVALTLQEAEYESESDDEAQSRRSTYQLWETLNSALHMMGRGDLASLTLTQNIEALQAALPTL